MRVNTIRKIIISRTDAIGDVVLTLPLATLIKKQLGEETKVVFWGRNYTQPVIECCDAIDEFLDYDSFAKLNPLQRVNFLQQTGADAIVHVFPRKEIAVSARKAGIPLRIGTGNRLYHWWTCNKLIKLSRKNSSLHEAQLNVKLLAGLGINQNLSLEELSTMYRISRITQLPAPVASLLSPGRFKLVIHPKSNASAREWSLKNYSSLINRLDKNIFQIIITGGENDKELLADWSKSLPVSVVNLAGSLSLKELISVLNNTDGILAASTGPLHLAASLGKYALGIYPPIRPMDPGRWGPLGKYASYVVAEKNCSDCRNSPLSCHCMNEISWNKVERRILQWLK